MKDGQEEAPGRSGDGGKNFRTAQGQVSTKELGVVNGTEERNLRYAAEDTKGLAEARILAAEYGLELVAFEGGNLTINSTRGVFEARAFIDGNRVCVRADHPKFSLLQLLKHEIAHRKIQKSKVDMKKVYKAVVNFATEEYVKHVIANYVAAYSSLEGYDADYILEEILCDYEAGMNIFSEEDVPASFWEMAQEILQSEDVKTDTARGPPTNWKASRDTKQEVGYGQKGRAEDHASFLRRVHEGSRRVKQIGEIVCAYEPARAIDTSGTVSDAAREFRRLGIKYFYHNGLEYNQNGITYVDNGALCTIEQQVVAIYAKAFGDGTVPTPLYAVGWKKADVAYKKLTEFMEVEDNGINRNGIRFGKGLKIVPDKQGKTSFSVYANGNRISTDGADSFPVRTSASDGRGDSRSSTENSNPEIKFSRESRKVNTFLRHFTGEVREGEYIWLSNVEAATIKSNIKSRDTYLNKDASGGLVWAHSATKQYAYVFICNPDYSVTVTDVYDADSDIDTINRTTERMINYARTGSDIRRNSSINGQQRNGNQSSYTGSRSNAETRQSQGNKGMVGQSSQSDRQGSMGAGQQNHTNSGADATRNASKVKFSREFVQAQMTEQERLLEQANKALERDNAKLQEDVKDLKALLKLQRSVTGGTKFTQSSVEAAAKMLKGKAQAKGSTKALAAQLNDLYEFIATSKDLTWEAVAEQAQPAVDWLMENRQQDFAPEGQSEEMARQALLHEVYDSYWRVSTLRTVADAKQKEINQLKAKHYAQMEKVRQAHRETIQQLESSYRERMKEIQQAYKLRTEEKVRKIKAENWEKRREATARRKESEAVKKNRAIVEKNAKSLMDMLAHPTKDAHVPMALQAPLREFLDSIDFSSKTQLAGEGMTIRDVAYTRALHDMRLAIAKQQSALTGAEDGEFTLDLPDGFLEEIDKHIRTVNEATKGMDLTTNRVYEMSGAELADLGHLLRTINKLIGDIDKLHMAGGKARVSELSRSTVDEMSRRKAVKSQSGGKAMWANYTPYYAFRRMGTAAQEIFKGLTQGQGKLARTVDAVIRFAEQTYTTKEVQSWESRKNVKTITLDSGKTIQLTPAQIMSFWCLSQRQQAVGHINGGGIFIDSIGKGTSKIVQKGHYLLTTEDVKRINSLLTDRQKAVAIALQRYMQDVGGKLINEISMARWDYMVATEENYYPIKTDDATRDAKSPDGEKAKLWALLNKSFTKSVQPNANTALIVSSIFDVFADHMSEAAEYNAFALPLVDAMKWFNYRERVVPGSTSDGGKQHMSREFQKDASLAKMEEQNDERRTSRIRKTGSSGLAGEQDTGKSGHYSVETSAERQWRELGREKQRQLVDLLDLYSAGNEEVNLYLAWYVDEDVSYPEIRRQALEKMAQQFYEAMQGNRVLLENDGRFRWLGNDISVFIQDVEAIQAGTYAPINEWETDSVEEIKTSREFRRNNSIAKTEDDINGGRKEETREAFYRRANEALLTVDERGTLAWGYRPSISGQSSENAKATGEELRKLGVPFVIHTHLETNRNGITRVENGDASTIPGIPVFVSNNIKADPVEAAGHEAFHYWGRSAEKQSYIEAVVSNISFSSEAFISYQNNCIGNKYFEEDVALYSEEWEDLMEEIVAYVTGDIHSGDSRGELHEFLRDYDAVKAAWDTLVEQQKGKTEIKTSREFQESNGTQITKGMSDAERYAVLKDKKISLKAKVNTEALRDVESKIGQSTDVADMISLTERKKLFRRLGEEFGVFKGYENADVNLIFEFSKNNMRESTNKQRKNYADFAKMFSCFDDVIDNAIGIEIHNRNADGYKVDPTLKDTYVLVSAFEDGENIVPVKLEIKEFSDKKNALYVAIALEGIKKDEVIKQGNTENGVTQSSRSSTISLADLFEKINPGDESFLKYVPRQFLESKSYVSDGLKTSREATATPVTTAATDTHIEDISVQRSIRDTLGTAAVKYFVDLMTDINSSQKAGRHENLAGKHKEQAE